jgi:glycerophosphoryl diester phosphodiesterase
MKAPPPTSKPALHAALFLALTCASLNAVEIVAHRGASYDAPENTMAATTLAWKQNADAVETDIYLGKDGKLIVFHDKPSAKRTTGRDVPIHTLTQAEARELDAGSWKGPQFKGEKIPLLEEQIASIPPGKRLLAEIKPGPEIVPELKRVLKATGADEKRIAIISFNYESLKEVRKRLPRYETLYLVGYKAPDPKKAPSKTPQPTLDQVIREAKAAKLTGLDLQHTWPLDAAAAKKIKDAGLQLHVWTVDDVAIARRWIELGVASITTNRPAWLREQLAR